MTNKNLITCSNFAIKSNNNINTGVAIKSTPASSFAIIIFAGTMMLHFPGTMAIHSQYSDIQSSYIQCIDLKQEMGLRNLQNRAIDLLKIKNLDKIKKMSQFKENWNGTGGMAFTPEAISVFRSIIEGLDKQPDIAPTGRNSLLMQYELDDKSLLAFEVGIEKTEKVIVPMGDYSMAQMETFTENVAEKMKESIGQFYGFKEH